MFARTTISFLVQWMLSRSLPAYGTQCLDGQHCESCDVHTGWCLTSCENGYFDNKCKGSCSENCIDKTCNLTSDGIGACTKGCVPGYFGRKCVIRCRRPYHGCKRCPNKCENGYCRTSSFCVSECVDSYYGKSCRKCSAKCKVCNRKTGTCQECASGYCGKQCEYSTRNCCNKPTSCTDLCKGKCLPGFYGTFCAKSCSSNCSPVHSNSSCSQANVSDSLKAECDSTTGDCLHGCTRGWYGPMCGSECTYCRDNNCDNNGVCINGCRVGHFGQECRPCPQQCNSNICNMKTGFCLDGCQVGFWGEYCNKSCRSCKSGACSQSTRDCIDKCSINGENNCTCTKNCLCGSGYKCSSPTPWRTISVGKDVITTSTGTAPIHYILVGISSAILLVIVTSLLVLCMYRHKLTARPHATRGRPVELNSVPTCNGTQESPPGFYWEICEDNLAPIVPVLAERAQEEESTDSDFSADSLEGVPQQLENCDIVPEDMGYLSPSYNAV